MKFKSRTRIIIILGLIILSQKSFSQETITVTKQPDDTVLISEIKFLQYEVKTLHQIVSIQYSSISNVNRILQIMNEENKQMRNEINSLHKTLEVLNGKKIKRRAPRKQKIEPLKQ